MTVQGFRLSDCQRVNSDVTFLSTPSMLQPDSRAGAQLFHVPSKKFRVRRAASLRKTFRQQLLLYFFPSPTTTSSISSCIHSQCLTLKGLSETGNVYSPDPEKVVWHNSALAHSQRHSQLLISEWELCTLCGWLLCCCEGFSCATYSGWDILWEFFVLVRGSEAWGK